MNKQIEEHIAFVEMQNELCDKPCDICKMYGKECIPERMAKKLAKKGYRKSTDVAREIFAEIVNFIFSEIPNELMLIYKERDFRDGVISGKREAFFKVLNHLDNHLRKKYESEGADDEN